jgi:hypothetical protein
MDFGFWFLVSPHVTKTGIRGRSCNPSYWEVGIWGWFGVRGDFLSGYSHHMSVRTGLPDHTMQTKFQSQQPSDVETTVPSNCNVILTNSLVNPISNDQKLCFQNKTNCRLKTNKAEFRWLQMSAERTVFCRQTSLFISVGDMAQGRVCLEHLRILNFAPARFTS